MTQQVVVRRHFNPTKDVLTLGTFTTPQREWVVGTVASERSFMRFAWSSLEEARIYALKRQADFVSWVEEA